MEPTFFSLRIPTTVLIGNGVIECLKEEMEKMGSRTGLLITTESLCSLGIEGRVKKALQQSLDCLDTYKIGDKEPAKKDVIACFSSASKGKYDLIIGLGGGSSMDVAKFVASGLSHPGGVTSILDGEPIVSPAVNNMMIPTTAGTGAEVTQNAIFIDEDSNLKKGIVSTCLFPTKAAIDPELMVTMPAALTASTGMDALAHSLESYISKKANAVSDLFARDSIRLIFKSLKKACDHGHDLGARMDMALASLYGGIALSHSGTCAVHALSYPLGGIYRIPHGISNAILLLPVIEVNQPYIKRRLSELAMCIGFPETEENLDSLFVGELRELIEYLGIPKDFSSWNIPKEDLELISASACKVTRLLKNNPRELHMNDIRSIYEKII
jgi:alcohol dehydrogenase class IV